MAKGGFTITWTVQGDRELAQKLAELRNPDSLLRNAVRRGLTVLQRSIKELIPPRVSTTAHGKEGEPNRSIRAAIGQRVTNRRPGNVGAKVGVSVGTTYAAKRGLSKRRAIAHLAYMAGTKERVQQKTGRRTGRVFPKSYVSHGGKRATGEAFQRIEDTLKKNIDKHLARQRSRETRVLV